MSELKKWAVHMDVSANIVVEVDAPSAEAAEETAWDTAGVPSLCHHCAKRLHVHDFTGTVDVEELEP